MSEAPKPLDVYEDAGTGNKFVAYVTRNGVELDCMFDGVQPWFAMADFAAIYGVTVPTINEHIQRFKADGELDNSTIRDFLIVRREGTRDGKLTLMPECSELLDAQLRQLNRVVLDRPGPPSSMQAKQLAKERYAEFTARRRAEAQKRTDEELAGLKAAAKALPRVSDGGVKKKSK